MANSHYSAPYNSHFLLFGFISVIQQYIYIPHLKKYTIHNAKPHLLYYFHTILMVRSVICICLASCHLCSIKHCQPASKTLPMYHHLRTQPHTISGPSPVFVVCGCLDEAEGGRPAVRPLHMFPIPPFADLLLSSLGLLVPSRLSAPLLASLCVSFSLHVHQIAH